MLKTITKNAQYKPSFSKLVSTALLTCFAAMGNANAATFNVSDEAQLNAALNTALTNQQDDVIDLGGSSIVLTSGIELDNLDNYETRIKNGTMQAAQGSTIRLFRFADPVRDNTSVVFENMTLENGNNATVEAITDLNGGGAIFSHKVDIELINSTLNNNISNAGSGGAVKILSASLVSNNSVFTNNSAADGGAIALRRAVQADISDTTFDGNTTGRGGAIWANSVTLTTSIDSSTFTNNQASAQAGAIWSRDANNIQRSTFYNNTAAAGGAIYLQPFTVNDTTLINRSTFVNNASSTGETLYFQGRIIAPDFQNSIVIGSNNTSAVNCVDTSPGIDYFPSGANNITDDNSCNFGTVIANGSTLFTTGAPANNGGNTQTIALGSTSAAIDAGAPQGATTCSALLDQRGEPVTSNCEVGSFEFKPVAGDSDGDGKTDDVDNCPMTANGNQDDFNMNGVGDACEDSDGDNVLDIGDNCPVNPNTNQDDVDQDGLGDACDSDSDNDTVDDAMDNCPLVANTDQANFDMDANGDLCDTDDDNDGQTDLDETYCGSNPFDAASLSADVNNNGIPDCTEEIDPIDTDSDGVADDEDNCPLVANAGQLNADGDAEGNACDLDDDNDLQSDADELQCGSSPLDATSKAPDADGDNIPDCVDPDFVADTDGDGFGDNADNCPVIANADQLDFDMDGLGNVCDPDDDNDGVLDDADAFPLNAAESVDTDQDGFGDNSDNCPLASNANQLDSNGNGVGDACEPVVNTGGIKGVIADIKADIEALVSSAQNGLIKFYINYAVKQLGNALDVSNWASDNVVSDRHGRKVFYRAGVAAYKLEVAAQSYQTEAALKSPLAAASTKLSEQMAKLASNEIDAAVAAGGNQWRIAYAKKIQAIADDFSTGSYLPAYRSIHYYGIAWYYANLSY